MQLTYALLPAAIAKFADVSGDAGGAFRAHLRKLRAEGIPGGASPGKGRRVAYTVPLVIEATIAIELLQMGWSPSQAARLVRTYRQDMLAATLLSLMPSPNGDQDVLMAVTPLGPGTVADRAGAVSFVTREKAGLLFRHGQPGENLVNHVGRWAIIDLATATLMTLGSIAHIGFPIEVAVEDLEKAFEDYGETILGFRKTRLNTISTSKKSVGT